MAESTNTEAVALHAQLTESGAHETRTLLGLFENAANSAIKCYLSDLRNLESTASIKDPKMISERLPESSKKIPPVIQATHPVSHKQNASNKKQRGYRNCLGGVGIRKGIRKFRSKSASDQKQDKRCQGKFLSRYGKNSGRRCARNARINDTLCSYHSDRVNILGRAKKLCVLAGHTHKGPRIRASNDIECEEVKTVSARRAEIECSERYRLFPVMNKQPGNHNSLPFGIKNGVGHPNLLLKPSDGGQGHAVVEPSLLFDDQHLNLYAIPSFDRSSTFMVKTPRERFDTVVCDALSSHKFQEEIDRERGQCPQECEKFASKLAEQLLAFTYSARLHLENERGCFLLVNKILELALKFIELKDFTARCETLIKCGNYTYRSDFALCNPDGVTVHIEVKKHDMKGGVCQNLTQLKAYADSNCLNAVYGITTTYEEWIMTSYRIDRGRFSVALSKTLNIGQYRRENFKIVTELFLGIHNIVNLAVKNQAAGLFNSSHPRFPQISFPATSELLGQGPTVQGENVQCTYSKKLLPSEFGEMQPHKTLESTEVKRKKENFLCACGKSCDTRERERHFKSKMHKLLLASLLTKHKLDTQMNVGHADEPFGLHPELNYGAPDHLALGIRKAQQFAKYNSPASNSPLASLNPILTTINVSAPAPSPPYSGP